MTAPRAAELPPLVKTITVDWSQEAAFRRFTEQIAAWWPLASHSVGQDRAETVVFEGRVGGRIYERLRGGEEATWGKVTIWEPPRRLAFTWHPGRGAEGAQDIEVRFVPEAGRTRLELTQSGWERLGPMAKKARRGYALGWEYVLRLWAERRSSPIVWALDAVMWVLSPLQKRMARKAGLTTDAARGSA
jgi:uncharacterized protein YndB with AHSA1/START domain